MREDLMRGMGTVVVGLGNPLAGDDGAGCRLAEELGRRMHDPEGLTILTSSLSPFRLLSEISGFRRLILIDSVTTGCSPPGTLVNLPAALPPGESAPCGTHHLTLEFALELGRGLGMELPEQVSIYAVEIERPVEYRDRLSPCLESSLGRLAGEILGEECARHEPIAQNRSQSSP